MHVLVLSPHRDDAAFSLSLSIGSWLAAGHRVTLLNVFTRSLYAPYSDADTVHENDRLSYVSAMRKKEDEAFLRHLPGLTMRDLNLKDAPIRLRCATENVCEMATDPDDAAIPKIRKALAAHIESSPSVVALVLPLALGQHVDHRVVRDAALALTDEHPSSFYEDLPYASREGAQTDLDRFREGVNTWQNKPLHPVLVHSSHPQPVSLKLKTTVLYASQIDQELAATIAEFSKRYGGAERLWCNDHWLRRSQLDKLSSAQRDEQASRLP